MIPLALWNIAVGRGGSANLLLLGVATLAQVRSSGYHAVLAVFVLATTLAFFARRLWRRGRVGRFNRDVIFKLRPWEEGVECATETPRRFLKP